MSDGKQDVINNGIYQIWFIRRGKVRFISNAKRPFPCGPSAVIRAERIKRAKELLTQPEKPAIGDIATQVGIPDANYFSRIFKAETGTTPMAYRKQKGKK